MQYFTTRGIGQWISALIIFLGPFSVGISFSWSTPALPLIIDGSSGVIMSEDQLGVMLSMMYVGNLVSPLFTGWCMDRIGRRNTFFISNLFSIAGWLIMIFSTGVIQMSVARFLIGFWNGAALTVTTPYLAELVHTSVRGKTGVMLGQSLFFGGLYASISGVLKNYKLLNIISCVPSILVFFGVFLLPESPYYSLMKGKKEKAKRDITWLQGEISDDQIETMNAAVQIQMANRGRLKDLFAPGTRIALGMVTMLCVVQRGAGMTIIFTYSSVVIPDSWVSPASSFFIICPAWIISTTITGFIIDHFGRREIFIASCLGVTFTSTLVSIWYYLRDEAQTDMSSTQWLPLVLFTVYALFFGLGLGSIPNVVASEIFPVNVKGLGSALYTITGSVISGIVVRLYYPIKSNVGLYSNFVIFAAVPLAGIVFALTLMIETRGKTMEEIQDILAEYDSKKLTNGKKTSKEEPSEPKFSYTARA